VIGVGDWTVDLARLTKDGWEEMDDLSNRQTSGSLRAPMHQSGVATITWPKEFSVDFLEPGTWRVRLSRTTKEDRDAYVLWTGVCVSTNQQTGTFDDPFSKDVGLGSLFVRETYMPAKPLVDRARALLKQALSVGAQHSGVRVQRLGNEQEHRSEAETYVRTESEDVFVADVLSTWADKGLIYSAWGDSIWLASVRDKLMYDGAELIDAHFERPIEVQKTISPFASTIRGRSSFRTVERTVSSLDVLPIIERTLRDDQASLGRLTTLVERLLARSQEPGISISASPLLASCPYDVLVFAPGTIHSVNGRQQRVAQMDFSWENGTEKTSPSPTFTSPNAEPYRASGTSVEDLVLQLADNLNRKIQAVDARAIQLELDRERATSTSTSTQG
jgi:hypothetical protein